MKTFIRVLLVASAIIGGNAVAACGYTANGTYVCQNGNFYHGTTPGGSNFDGHRSGNFDSGKIEGRRYNAYHWGNNGSSTYNMEDGQQINCWGTGLLRSCN